MCYDGPAKAVLKELPTLADSDWLARGIAGLSGAPTTNDLSLTPTAERCFHAIGEYCDKVEDARTSATRLANMELFGIA